MNQKGFVLLYILIGILILIGIAGGAYYLWAQEYRRTHPIGPLPIVVPENIPLSRNIDETATWKTYTNTEYGFSIKYPDFITYKEKLFNDVTFYYKIDDEDIPENKYDFPSYFTKGLGILFRTGPAEQAASSELPNRPQEKVQINNSEGVRIKDSLFNYYLSSKGNTKQKMK